MNNTLDALFMPARIAVVGASPRKNWIWSSGNAWIAGSIAMGLQGTIYPVHPKAESIMGYQAFPTISDIPDEIDLAIIAIPLTGVIDVLKQCIKKGVQFAHLLTAGFSETGHETLEKTEQQIAALAQEGGIRLIGPNCMGVYCPEGGLSWSEELPVSPGPTSLFSQSGQLATEIVLAASSLKPRFCKVVSFGNACDLKAHDFLNYFGNDAKTEIIAAYLEGTRDGRLFFESALRITKHKPLVILKGGRTSAGRRAIRSHTGSIAGSRAIWKAMCKQAGIISVNSVEDLVNTLQALQLLPMPAGKNVAILGCGCFNPVTMTDYAEKAGLIVTRTANLLNQKRHKPASPLISRGIDPTDDTQAILDERHYHSILTLLQEDPKVDSIMLSINLDHFIDLLGPESIDRVIEMISNAAKKLNKSLFIILEQGTNDLSPYIRKPLMDRFNQDGIAIFTGFSTTARIIYKLQEYHEYLSRCSRD